MPHDTLTAAVRRIYRDAAERNGLTDADLLARFAATRDEAAFEVLVWRHGPMVLGVCRRVLGDPHDADDAFQTTFFNLASRAGSVRTSLAAWLYQVAYHAALRLRKDRARRAMATLPGEVAAPTRKEGEASVALDEELQRLPRKYREPLVLAYLQGHSNQQVADALGCPVGTVFTRLSRGRERLRAALARRGLSLAPALPAVALGASQVRAAVLGSGTVSGASLTGGALALATAHKLKSLAGALLLVGFVAVGMFAAGPTPVPAKRLAAVGPPAAKNDLPEGAVARLGTMRFRHAGADQFAVRADGKTVVTGGYADTFRTWDLATGKLLSEVKRPKASPTEPHLLLPGGKTFARIDGKELVLMDTTTGKPTRALKLGGDDYWTLTASPDGTMIALLEGKAALGVYALATGKRMTIPLPPEMTKARGDVGCAFSPDNGRLAVSAGGVRFHTVHEVASGREVQRLKYPSGRSVFSPDGKTLFIAFENGAKEEDMPGVVALDTKTWKTTGSLRLDKGFACYGMAVAPDGKTLGANVGFDTCLIDIGTMKVTHRFRGRIDGNLGFGLDSKKFLAMDNRLRVWEVASGEEFDPASLNFVSFRAPEISPDGKLVAATGRMDADITLWDLRTAKLVRRLPLTRSLREVMVLRFADDSKTLFAATVDGFIQRWRVADGKELASYQLKDPPWREGEKFRAQTLFISVTAQPGGKRLSVLESDFLRGDVSMSCSQWDVASGKRVTEHVLPMRPALFSPDGSTLAVAGRDGLKLLDVATGNPLWRDPAKLGDDLDASPDFRLLAGRKDEKTMTVRESRTGKVVATLATGAEGGYTLTGDNRSVVTLHENRLRVWDLATGKEVLSRTVPDGTNERTFAVLPNGRRALTLQDDGTVLLWDIARPPTRIEATPKELAAWWADLASPDAARAWGAAWKLADARAVATLRQLRPAVSPDPAAMRKWILRSNADTLAERDAAERELSALGEPALPYLRPALEKSVNNEQGERLIRLIAGARTSPEQLRRLRAVGVLERIGDEEARALLRKIAGGAATAPETVEAGVALRRLGE